MCPCCGLAPQVEALVGLHLLRDPVTDKPLLPAQEVAWWVCPPCGLAFALEAGCLAAVALAGTAGRRPRRPG